MIAVMAEQGSYTSRSWRSFSITIQGPHYRLVDAFPSFGVRMFTSLVISLRMQRVSSHLHHELRGVEMPGVSMWS